MHLQAVLSDVEATGKPTRSCGSSPCRASRRRRSSSPASATERRADRHTTTPSCAVPPVPRCARVRGKKAVAVALPTPDVESLGAVADGAYAGCYTYDKAAPLGGRRAAAKAPASGAGPRVVVVSGTGQGKAARDAVARAAVLGCGPRLGARPRQHPAEPPLPPVLRRRREEAGHGVHRQGLGLGARREGARQGWLRGHRRRRPGVGEPAPDRDDVVGAGRSAGVGRARRQGDHLRLRRPQHQAHDRHGDDEVRHGRGGCRRGDGPRRGRARRCRSR